MFKLIFYLRFRKNFDGLSPPKKSDQNGVTALPPQILPLAFVEDRYRKLELSHKAQGGSVFLPWLWLLLGIGHPSGGNSLTEGDSLAAPMTAPSAAVSSQLQTHPD